MTTIAPTSSTIASVSRNSLRLAGTRSPAIARIATANAMSVAMGIAHPRPPPPPARAARVDAQVEECGEHHAPGRGDRRQARGAWVAQLAAHELALDLQADDEEEDGHQSVVDPVLQVLGDGEVPDADGQVGGPEVHVGDPGEVGPEECRDRRA